MVIAKNSFPIIIPIVVFPPLLVACFIIFAKPFVLRLIYFLNFNIVT